MASAFFIRSTVLGAMTTYVVYTTDYSCASIGSKFSYRTNSINMNSNNRMLSSFDFLHDDFVCFSDSSLLTSNVVELYLFCGLFQLCFIQLTLLIATIKRWQSHCFNFVSIFCLCNNFIITVTLQFSEWNIHRVLLWLWCKQGCRTEFLSIKSHELPTNSFVDLKLTFIHFFSAIFS